MITEENFSIFKQKYYKFITEHRAELTENFRKSYTKLQCNYKIVKELVTELDRKLSIDFNIFSILDRGRYEVRTHTPFLAELLNPKGLHGQQNLFLSSFLIDLLNISKNNANDPEWNVAKESGYIDLRIVNYNLKKAVFIENKIYTDAHSGQLSKYFKRWKEGYFKGNGAFIYLTPNGDEPASAGFNEKIFQKNEIMKEMKLFSYNNDIFNWLNLIYDKIESHRVQQTLKQYIDLIKNL